MVGPQNCDPAPPLGISDGAGRGRARGRARDEDRAFRHAVSLEDRRSGCRAPQGRHIIAQLFAGGQGVPHMGQVRHRVPQHFAQDAGRCRKDRGFGAGQQGGQIGGLDGCGRDQRCRPQRPGIQQTDAQRVGPVERPGVKQTVLLAQTGPTRTRHLPRPDRPVRMHDCARAASGPRGIGHPGQPVGIAHCPGAWLRTGNPDDR